VAERAVAYGGGLFGRRTAQIRLGPLAPRYTADFLPSYRASELAVAYAVSNGVPHYLALFNGGRGLEEILAFLFSRWGLCTKRPRTSSATRCGSPTSISTS
jgi:hypothetical protein